MEEMNLVSVPLPPDTSLKIIIYRNGSKGREGAETEEELNGRNVSESKLSFFSGVN